MSSPRARYQTDLEQDGFLADSSQELAVTAFEDLYQLLLVKEKLSGERVWRRATRRMLQASPASPKGLYLWGGVGRGKTYLMDIFFESLPFDNKMRVHFHRFMRRVHKDLTALKGEINPLRKVAAKIADETCVICFDEFFVSDIADAMILAGLLEELFRLEVCLVTTSNIVPDLLYRDGLQRQRFLPAIALLKQHCQVINVDGGGSFNDINDR